ncbi:hypothetical protein NH340_JMT05249 [Sarcoptes scabiei]|nr:hypothetical protein NH340_JMT05249 [Sarcoptes scabiei]
MSFCQIRAILIDLSGTIHIDSKEIVGSIDALVRLKRSPIRYKFVTNTTKESVNSLWNRLKAIGFDLEKSEIFSSLVAARDYLQREKLRPHFLLEDAAKEDFQDLQFDQSSQEAVVVGLAPSKFNYEALNESFNKLLAGAKLISIHQGRYYQTGNGLALGPGPFVKALAYAASVNPDSIPILGKPNPEFFRAAINSLTMPDLKPEEVIMIGDDINDDIAGAMAIGMQAVLVKTGKYREGDEEKIDPPPTMIFSTFAEAIETILVEMCN